MLAQIEPARADFHALARYLMAGKEIPPNSNRVAWLFAHNLHTDDPELVATLMAATAALSRRCTEPCYHLSINWREDEAPSPEVMRDIALKTLSMAGLAKHQAFIVGHGDKPHRHLHMMINRIHPDTGRAWSTSHDYRRLDRIMRELADQYGFEHAPCHRFDPAQTAGLPKKPNSAATHAGRRGAPTRRLQWSADHAQAYGARLSERLDAASSWDDLVDLAASDGLTVEAKGRGHVIGNATSYVKLSALGLQRTAKGFARRPLPAKRMVPSRPLVDAVDIARGLAGLGLADRSDVRDALAEANAQRLARLAKRPLIEQLLADLWKMFRATTAHKPLRRRAPAARRPPRRPAQASRTR